ncbi:hypothetical protein L9F63_019868, partial [Diploptera punctata]
YLESMQKQNSWSIHNSKDKKNDALRPRSFLEHKNMKLPLERQLFKLQQWNKTKQCRTYIISQNSIGYATANYNCCMGNNAKWYFIYTLTHMNPVLHLTSVMLANMIIYISIMTVSAFFISIYSFRLTSHMYFLGAGILRKKKRPK